MSGMVSARNIKLDMQIHHQGCSRKKCKIRSNGVENGSRDLLLKFRDFLHISRTVRSRYVKFGMQIHHQGYYERNAKLGQHVSGRSHVTYFWNFGTPSISRERLELETSNLACRFIMRSINEKKKIMLKGSRRGHMTCFWNFGNPPCLGNEVVITQPWIELSYRNLVLRETWTLLNECCY